jgi:hypothetical protein
MSADQTLWLAIGVLAVACVVLLALTVADRRSAGRERAAMRSEVDALRSRLAEVELTRASPTARPDSESAPAAEFVITEVGSFPAPGADSPEPSAPLDGAAFADTVLRETVVKAASLAHGVRRGLAPATRNRIRFEMRQEVRRARRQRRSDSKQALREKHARERAVLAEEAEAR